MDFLKDLLKVLVIIAMLLLMAMPFIGEYLEFHKDKQKKLTYKRFRQVAYTLVYIIAITITIYVLKDMLIQLEQQDIIQWIVKKLALSDRFVYCAKVLVAILVNFAVGFLHGFLAKFVRIGLKKKDLVTPKKKNGEYSWAQKAERKIVKFFYTETWFFVASILKWISIVLSAIYLLVFTAYQIPAVFPADWIPYNFISNLFSAGYLYPTITLLGLWQSYFFLAGIERLEQECPALVHEEAQEEQQAQIDLQAIDAEVRKQFGDFYACDVDLSAVMQEEVASTDHHPASLHIAQAVEIDKRNPQLRKEAYLECLDKLVEGKKGVLINGNFFTEFSMYFLRYLSVVLARGDNVIFVCNNDAQINATYDYLKQGLSEISSLYCKGFRQDAVDFDDPIWRLCKVSGEHSVVEEAMVDDCNVLITSLSYLCSTRFENEHSRFITLVDAVVFTEALDTLNTFNRQMAVLNTRLKHITKKNALAAKNSNKSDMFRVKYASRQVRYICFDDSRTPGLDKVLKNMLSVDFDSVDAMRYSPKAIVRCYNYEGQPGEDGRITCPQFFNSEEEVGAVMNMAVLCLAKGASSVTVFAEDLVPYENYAETVTANMGQISIKADGSNIRLNKQYYNPDAYSVIIAMDAGDNLPAALRRYLSMVSDKPSLIMVFSRPYLLRDYYLANINALWGGSQVERIPVEEGTKRDIAQKILIRANAEGISRKEILKIVSDAKFMGTFADVPEMDTYIANQDVDAILKLVLEIYGETITNRLQLYNYFEYISSRSFDESGKYNSETKIVLRRRGRLFEMLNGRDMVMMTTGEEDRILPMPGSRLTQNYIAGQNILYNGSIYHIQRIDSAAKRLYARLAVGGKNDEAYRYLQDRHYRLEATPEKIVPVFPTKHVVMKAKDGDVAVSDVYVSVFRTPMEVLTNGYYEIDPRTLAANAGKDEYHSICDPGNDMLAKQTYRRYGSFTNPTYSTETVLQSTHLTATEKGAMVMSLRMCGEFGSDVNKTMLLAAAMLNELLKSMFPSVADAIAVCPVLRGEMEGEDAQAVCSRQPQVTVLGESEVIGNTGFNLLIIEDSASDLGVVSVLMSAGDDILKTLFTPIFKYLSWYANAEQKSGYLRYGMDHEPTCFDFAALQKLSKLVGDTGHDVRFVNMETVVEHTVCAFCGKRYAKADEVITLEDGRKMCKACAENLVGNNKKVLKAHLDRARLFLESTYGITLGDDYEVCFESTVKIANTLKQNRNLVKRGADVPLRSYIDDKKKVHVEYSLPSVNLSELLVRELTHAWQLNNLPDMAEDLAEGHIALVAVQYLRFLNENALATVRTTYYESTTNLSGEGYRRLVRELLENPQYRNNPFYYLLGQTGQSVEDKIVTPKPRITAVGDFGLPYTASAPDRALDGNLSYFYYPRLTATYQKAYDAILAAAIAHAPEAEVEGCTIDDVSKITDAIAFDHPELFWYDDKHVSLIGNRVQMQYGVSAEEAAVLQCRIDEEAAKYLEGIDDTMSAYDVALRLHVKMISAVDYDTIALERQKSAGGPQAGQIDYLRTICGVFLDRKAVCEGYARAMQYLLQKCGVECAEAAGFIRKPNGENAGGHAWNILKLDGEYYYLDTTWDDSSNTIQEVKTNDLGLDYFAVTTEEITRTRDLTMCPAEPPRCEAIRCNYYQHNDLVLDGYDPERIKVIAQNAAKAGQSFFTLKCKTKAVFDRCHQALCVDGTDCFAALKVAAKQNKKIVTTKYAMLTDTNIWTITIKFEMK